MRVSVGLELNNEGRALAWALNVPGCFAYGAEGPDAVVALARALADHARWVERHAGPGWLALDDYDLRVEETWQVYTIDDNYQVVEAGYAVNAWFRHDWQPLSAEEVERGLALLAWSRSDLFALTGGLSQEQLDRSYPDERWSIRGLLKHVGGAEWWYLDRLGLVAEGRAALPGEALARLAWSRERLRSALPALVGVEQVIGKEGEFWSPRKLLRRALWHEIDHREHIARLLGAV